MKRPPVYFLIPGQYRPAAGLPQTIEAFWPWLVTVARRGTGGWEWTLQTYLYLRAGGFACELANALPDGGIVIAHRDFLPDSARPGKELLLVCILADREEPIITASGRHPYAQLHIVQNPQDPMLTHPHALWKGHYLPLWPQPGLLPRAAARGDRFENAAFFGRDYWLAPELSTSRWEASLRELGLTWHVVPPARCHDYRQIDVVVAARNFARANDYLYKPASKLHNAWRAGVPAVLGPEAAYRCERQSHLDYLAVTSLDETVRALQRLRDDLQLRHAMVANGTRRALAWTPAKITALWETFLNETAWPTYALWVQSSAASRTRWCARRSLARYRRGLVRRGRRLKRRLVEAAVAARSFVGER